jgi:hypothetical protein
VKLLGIQQCGLLMTELLRVRQCRQKNSAR